MHQAAPNIEEIFFAALEIEGRDSRSAFLDQACGDPELRRRVERLLARDAQASGFLESPAAPPTVTVESPSLSEGPDTVIGPYKLREQIGEGGMGVVYVAEQTQPVRRKVALKIIKPGMDTKQVIARFEAERQALAMMDHPNIAKVHDAGTTESGRPYFVMELVRGIPITDYCDRERLSIPERLELFVQVCRAVQHAHQKGIIHRDLKPSNILVTVIDGAAVPKVIDFGVAKATGGQLTERTLYTAFQQFVGTPLYMSPEQADLSGMDVDTRSDIYSLGVLLYELLTGTTPFDQETFRQAAFDEVRRIIREQEPPKPSTRLSSLGETRATVSANRKADARHLDRAVRGELDWIVMKALEKDRRRRYETANDFASDVMRYLTDQTVEACPPSAWYRFRKFASRNRKRLATMTLLTVSGLIVVLVLGAVYLQNASRVRQITQDVRQALAGARTAIEAGDLTLAGQRVAEAQGHLGSERERLPDVGAEIDRTRHEIEARQADAARFSRFLKGASDAQDRRDTGEFDDGDRVAEGTLGLYGILTDKDWLSRLESSYLTADQQQQVRETAYATLVSLADFYVRWRGSEPKSVERSLDLLQRAQAFHQPTRAFFFVRAGCRRAQGNTAAAHEDEKQFKAAPAQTAWDYFLPGHTAGWRGDLDEAIRSYQAALRLQPNHFNSLYFLAMRLGTDKINRHPEAIAYYTACLALRPDHFGAYISRGTSYHKLGRLDTAEADDKAALALAKDDPDRCMSLYSLASDYTERREYSKAEPLLVQALEVGRRFFGEDHPETLNVMNRLGVLYLRQGQDAKAEPLFAKAMEGRRRISGEEHRETLTLMHNLADTYRDRGKLAEAEALFVKTLVVRRRVQGGEHLDTLHNTEDLAGVYEDRHEYSKAEPLRVQALEIRRRVQGEEHPDTLRCLHNLAAHYKNQGEFTKAEPLFIKTLEIGRRVHGETHPDMLTAASNLAELYNLNRKFEHSIPLLEQAWPKALKQPDLPVDRLTAISVTLGQAYDQAGQFAKAESLYREALETVRLRHAEGTSDFANLQASLAMNLLKQQRYAEAEPLVSECLKFREQNEANDWTTFNTKSLLGGSLLGQKKYAEAESLLLAGYEGMQRRERKIPPFRKFRMIEAIERLVQFYEATGKKDKAAEWRAKLPEAKSAEPLR